MEIDEDWQTGKRYIRMDNFEEENDSNLKEDVMKEISRVKEGSKLHNVLVTQ